jgi:hypothetical protein
MIIGEYRIGKYLEGNGSGISKALSKDMSGRTGQNHEQPQSGGLGSIRASHMYKPNALWLSQPS